MEESNERTTNNGRAHTLNPGEHLQRGFICRSVPETLIVEACWQRKILYAPNCVFSYKRKIELDGFFIVDGVCLCLELDSSYHDSELMFDAEKRLEGFRDQGVPVVREKIPANANMEWAHNVVDRILEKIHKIWWQSYIAHGKAHQPANLKSDFTIDLKSKKDDEDKDDFSDRLPF